MYAITSPVPQFFDLSGDPLDAGKIYIGTAGSNPITSPVTVYWDDAGTQPAAQPIRTVIGYPARNGKPARVYVGADDFSMTVMTRADVVVQSELSVLASATLRVDLANETDALSGSKLIGYRGRTVFERLSEQINVKDFGAVGDGVTDDTAAIQTAMDYASDAGCVLLFPAGNYLCGKIDVPSNVWVIAEPGAVIVRTSNFGWCLSVYTSAISNVTIDGLQFDCNAPGTAGTHKHSVFIRESFNVKIRNCRFFNGYDIAVKVLGPDGIMIESLNPTVRNNILVEGCTFDGFTRNGVSVTDGANGLTFRDCVFTNNGLAGLDVEANVGSSVQITDLLVENCKFIDNGDSDIRGGDLPGDNLAIFSASPTAYHSTGVTVRGCLFSTKTAVNDLGIYYFRIDSTNGFTMEGCTFESPATASTHKVVFEQGAYGSKYGSVRANVFRDIGVYAYDFADLTISENKFMGEKSFLQGAANGARKIIDSNSFDSCGSSTQNPVRIYSPDLSITGNKFFDSRASNVPAIVLDVLAGSNTTALNSVKHRISGNTVSAASAKFGAFMNISGGSGLFGVAGVDISENSISGCTLGIQIASDGGSPNSFDVNVSNNTFTGLGGRAMRFYRVSRLTVEGNTIKDCASNTYAIGLDSCQSYRADGNSVFDTRSGTDRATYAVIAFSSPTPTSVLSNNYSRNTQSGFSIAGTEGTTANNVTY